ncbi:MAG: DUF4252 domain-containing protein [Terriglobia bacterium]
MSKQKNVWQRHPAPSGIMKYVMVFGILLPLFGPLAARAQSAKIQLDQLQKLASRAQEVTDVTLDQNMLQMALNFMSKDNSPGDAETRQLVKQLKGIYIKDFEFAKAGMYTQADIDQILSQVHAHPWERIISVRNEKEGENDEIYIMRSGNNIKGLLILSAEPKELAVVNIVGPIDVKSLSHLEGKFGIPKINLKPSNAPKPAK